MALATRMLWPASVVVRTFTGGSGRVYTYAPVLDVLTADVAAGTSAGLLTIGPSGAIALGNGQTNPATGNLSAPEPNPPGGWAGIPAPQPYPDPNRPTQPQTAGTLYLDAALGRLIVSTGTVWVDPVTGNTV